MDLAEGAGAATAPTQRDLGDAGVVRRLRSHLPWPSSTDDPLALLVRTHRHLHAHSDVAVLRRAYATAERMHRGQERISGEPYITHPVAVAQILAELGMDTTTLVAALLHDTVEDTSYTLSALHGEFGGDVALLVDGVTKFEKAYFGEDAEVETIRKMLVLAGQDVRVLIIKLADRLHNMRTLSVRTPASRVRVARATREMLIPLCDRLGIQALKRELEDACLQNLEPEAYGRIADARRAGPQWAGWLQDAIVTIGSSLSAQKVSAKVLPRPRHIYSIWKDAPPDSLRDVTASHPGLHGLPRIAIVVDGPANDCYAALGAVHGTWRPVPGRFKDYIAAPKNNLYRSLHTTLLCPSQQLLEVQIRTEAMDRSAEYGIVVNYRHPSQSARLSAEEREQQLTWLRQVLDWETVAADAASFLDALRCEMSESQIQVFGADGSRVQLPTGSTAVDFAYQVDPDRAHRCVAATRAGRLLALSTPLEDGDVIEIIYTDAPVAGPSREWLAFVRSPAAQLHITQWLDEREPASVPHRVRVGRAAIGLALRERDRGLVDDTPLTALATQLGYPDLEALLVAVADERLSADTVADSLIAAVDRSPV